MIHPGRANVSKAELQEKLGEVRVETAILSLYNTFDASVTYSYSNPSDVQGF